MDYNNPKFKFYMKYYRADPIYYKFKFIYANRCFLQALDIDKGTLIVVDEENLREKTIQITKYTLESTLNSIISKW